MADAANRTPPPHEPPFDRALAVQMILATKHSLSVSVPQSSSLPLPTAAQASELLPPPPQLRLAPPSSTQPPPQPPPPPPQPLLPPAPPLPTFPGKVLKLNVKAHWFGLLARDPFFSLLKEWVPSIISKVLNPPASVVR